MHDDPIYTRLRLVSHTLALFRPDGERHAVLGRAYPEEDDAEARRLAAAGRWNPEAAGSPRQDPPATVDIPLETRLQTILSYHLTPQERDSLNGTREEGNASRREAQAGGRIKVTIG